MGVAVGVKPAACHMRVYRSLTYLLTYWSGCGDVQLDSDWDNDDVLGDVDDDDSGGRWSKLASPGIGYSNTLFSIDEEEVNSSSGGGAASPSVKAVQWSLDDVHAEDDDDRRQSAPAAVTSVTTKRVTKPTVFEKKYRGTREPAGGFNGGDGMQGSTAPSQMFSSSHCPLPPKIIEIFVECNWTSGMKS